MRNLTAQGDKSSPETVGQILPRVLAGITADAQVRHARRNAERLAFARRLVDASQIQNAATPAELATELRWLEYLLDVPPGTDIDIEAVWRVVLDALSKVRLPGAA